MCKRGWRVSSIVHDQAKNHFQVFILMELTGKGNIGFGGVYGDNNLLDHLKSNKYNSI